MNLEEKKYYLKLIEKLCKKNKIKLKLIKGPIFNQTYAKSDIFISNYEKLFNNNNLYKTNFYEFRRDRRSNYASSTTSQK